MAFYNAAEAAVAAVGARILLRRSAAAPARRPLVLVLAGPTGVGKSDVAMALATALRDAQTRLRERARQDAAEPHAQQRQQQQRAAPSDDDVVEIVNGDSMQSFVGMDIGTAKPSEDDMRTVPHHLYSAVPVSDAHSVETYRNRALAVIHDVIDRGRLPVVVGGSGLYLRWLLAESAQIPRRSPEVDRRIEQTLEEDKSWDKSLQRLAVVDPVYASALSRNDYRRLRRALEIVHVTGRPVSERKVGPAQGLVNGCDFRCVFFTAPRVSLYRRLDARVEAMIYRGLIEETIALRATEGLRQDSVAGQALGYRKVLEQLRIFDERRAELNSRSRFEHIIDDIMTAHRNYAHRQWIWFRQEPEFTWVMMDALAQAVERLCHLLTLDRSEHEEARKEINAGFAERGYICPQEGDRKSLELSLRLYKPKRMIFDDERSLTLLMDRVRTTFHRYHPQPFNLL